MDNEIAGDIPGDREDNGCDIGSIVLRGERWLGGCELVIDMGVPGVSGCGDCSVGNDCMPGTEVDMGILILTEVGLGEDLTIEVGRL